MPIVRTSYKGKKYDVSFLPSYVNEATGNCGIRAIKNITIANVTITTSDGRTIYPKPFGTFGVEGSCSLHLKAMVNSIVSSARDAISLEVYKALRASYPPANLVGMQFLISDGINGDRSTGNYINYTMGYRTSDFMGWLLGPKAKGLVKAIGGPVTWNPNHPNPDLPSLVQAVLFTFEDTQWFKVTGSNTVTFTEHQTVMLETYKMQHSHIKEYTSEFWTKWVKRFFTQLYYSGEREE